MAGYQSIFAGSTPTPSSTPPATPSTGGYESIFGTPAHVVAQRAAIKSSQANEKAQLKKAAAPPPPKKSFVSNLFNRAKQDVAQPAKALAGGAVSAAKAIGRPTYDELTGQGGKTAHDTAQLSADVGTKAFTDLLREGPLKAVKAAAAGATNNKVAQRNALLSNRPNLKQIGGQVAQAGSFAVGAPESHAVIEGATKAGTRVLPFLKSTAKLSTAGAAGNAGATVAANPNATKQDIEKSAKTGAYLGAAGSAGVHLAGEVSHILSQPVPKLDNIDFGTQHTQFTNKPNEAVNHLLTVKSGEVPGFINKKGLGPIDLVYGKTGSNGYGLAHIEEKHGTEVARAIPDIIKNGNITHQGDRVLIETPNHAAAVRLDWNGYDKRWVATAFQKNPASSDGIATVKLSPTDSTGEAVVKNSVPSKVKKVNPDAEGGYVNPGAIGEDVSAMIKKHTESTSFAGDLEKGSAQTEGAKKVIQEDAGKVLQNRQQLSNADKQTLQDYRDAKAAGLTPKELPQHLVAEDIATTALNKATQAHDAELARLNGQEAKAQTIEARDPSTYTHREAMNKGGSLDYVSQGSRKNPLSVGGLGKTTPASKSRVFHAITDEQGNRRVVAIKNSVLKDEQGRRIAQGKLVQAIDEPGKSQNLGKLKLNTNREFLDKELTPYKTKINNLQKEYSALSKVKTKGGVSEARMDTLAKKAALLEDARNFSGLSKAEAKSLREATLKFQELSKVKAPGTTAVGRLKTLQGHLIDLHNKVSEIHDKYDPETLDKKVFVGKDGKQYTIGQATQSEITKATGQKYYVDPKLLAVKNYAESRTALENARFIQSFKDHPDFEKFASEPGKTAPKGWEGVKGLDQFRGYKFQPKTAEVLRDIVKTSGGDEKKLLDSVGNVLKQTIVYFPLKHSINEGVTYAVDRGLSSLVNPMAYRRGASSLVEAFHEVTNQGPKFQAAQKAGLHTVTGGDKALNDAFKKEIKNLSGNEKTVADVAKQWGTSPARLYNALQNITVWQLQDVLNMARVIERTKPKLIGKSDSLESAIEKTQKFNLQYSVPSRVGPRVLPGRARRGLANTLGSNKVFFGRYRYDLYRIMSNTIKDTVNLKSLVKNPSQNAQAVDKLAALALGTAIVWPLVDKGIQKVSDNKNAYMKAPGVLELPSAVKDIISGKRKPLTEASNQIYLSSAITQGVDVKSNRDSFTGKQIYDPNSSLKDQFKDIGKWLASQQAPTQQAKQGTSGKNKAIDILLSLASARLPKNSPEVNNLNSLKFDSLPGVQSDAKDKASKGDVNGAIDSIRSYDKQVLDAAKTALKAAGQPVPDDKTLAAKLKQQGYYYNPERSTVDGWVSPSDKKNTLDQILNATPKPKATDPGYLEYQQKQQQNKLKNGINQKDTTPVVTL